MADSLTVFGTDFTGVTGIKATGTGNGTLTYIRPQGTKSISSNGTGIDVTEYASVDVSVPSGSPSLQSKSVSYTPSESAQSATVTADSGYDGLSSVDVSVGAISSTYVGSGIAQRTSSDLTEYMGGVTVPAGYYEDDASYWLTTAAIALDSHNINASGYESVSFRATTPGYAEGMFSGGWQLDTQAATTITPSTSSQTAVAAGKYTTGAVTVAAMPAGTAGTPTAAKSSVSNHAISVTPSVTNTTGYITGGTKSGTAVTVSASELVSGSQTLTSNDTYDVTNLASVVVNVSGGGGSSMNVQVAQSTTRASSSTYTELVSLTCDVTGTYDIYWSCYRSSTSGTSGSQLYINGTASGSANTTFTNHIQDNHRTNVSITAGQEVSVYARSRGSSYYAYVGTLIIEQTA